MKKILLLLMVVAIASCLHAQKNTYRTPANMLQDSMAMKDDARYYSRGEFGEYPWCLQTNDTSGNPILLGTFNEPELEFYELFHTYYSAEKKRISFCLYDQRLFERWVRKSELHELEDAFIREIDVELLNITEYIRDK